VIISGIFKIVDVDFHIGISNYLLLEML